MPLFHVPSGATVSELCPHNLPHNEPEDAVQVSFKQRRQVIDTIVRLLYLFNIPSLSRPEVMSNTGSFTSKDSWILTVLTRLWEAIAPECAQLNYVDSTSSSVGSFLDHTRVFATRTSGFDPRSALVNRVSILCSQITTTFLVTELLPLPSLIEKRLCLLIFDLALTDLKSGPRLQSFAENTLLVLLEVRQDHKRFDAFGHDLQVRASRCSY